MTFSHYLEFFIELYDSLIEKKMFTEVFSYFPNIVEIAKIGFFLQVIRRDYGDKKICRSLFQKVAMFYQVTGTLFNKVIEPELEIVHWEGDNVIINISTYDDVIQVCEKIYDEFLANNVLTEYETTAIKIFDETIMPIEVSVLHSKFNNSHIFNNLIKLLLETGIVVKYARFYYQPRFFEEIDKKTIDLITDYNITPDEYIKSYTYVENNPGTPISSLDMRIQNVLHESSRLGLLKPVIIHTPIGDKTFIFANPKKLRSGNLAYEVASFFRYNELYADERLGRLDDATIFLEALISRGYAGNADSIALNYKALELKGVICVITGQTGQRPYMRMIKKDCISEARSLLVRKSDVSRCFQQIPSWISNSDVYRARCKKREAEAHNLIKILRDFG